MFCYLPLSVSVLSTVIYLCPFLFFTFVRVFTEPFRRRDLNEAKAVYISVCNVVG